MWTLISARRCGASIAHSLAYALGIPALGLHHLEGHLLSPLLGSPAPQFPFVALLVSGGHTQLMRVEAVGRYAAEVRSGAFPSGEQSFGMKDEVLKRLYGS